MFLAPGLYPCLNEDVFEKKLHHNYVRVHSLKSQVQKSHGMKVLDIQGKCNGINDLCKKVTYKEAVLHSS